MEESMEFRVRALEEESGRNLAAHKEFLEKFDRVHTAQARIDAQYANILAALAKMEAAVDELRAKPARRWEAVTAALLTAAAGFLAAALLGG